MTPPNAGSAALQILQASSKSVDAIYHSLQFKIQWLRQSKSSDAVQQLQTDAIIDLYEAVGELAELLDPTSPLWSAIIPDTSAARDAAAAAASAAAMRKLTTPAGAFGR